MNSELKNKWIKALRSGKYAQTRGALRCKGEYCCLGVLLQISDAGNWDKQSYVIEDNPRRWLEGDLGTYGEAFFGLSSKATSTLVTMNDAEGVDFNTIADWIEKNL